MQLDAYTVRKAVPRILIAVIGINLSIYLCVAALDITVIISRGLEQLLTEPFVGTDGIQVEGEKIGGNPVTSGVLLTTLVLAIFKVLVFGPGAVAIIGSIFPLILILGLIALTVLFTLVIRQALIIFLTIVSPVAIACFVLPGTEKYFKKWFDLFIKTLMVYPIIAGIFAMSNVLAAILLSDATGGTVMNNLFDTTASIHSLQLFAQGVGESGNADKALKFFAAVIIIYAPLVLIPFAFKLAGGAIATIANFADGATKRKRAEYTDGRRKSLGEAKEKRQAKMAAGGFSDRGPGRFLNSYGRRKAVGMQGRFGFGERGRKAIGLHETSAINDTLRNNAALYELRNDDDANNVLGLSGGTRAGAEAAARQLFGDKNGYMDEPAQAKADAAIAGAAAVGINRQNAVAAFQTSAQTKWRAVGAGRSDIIQQGATRLAQRNDAMEQSLLYSNAFHSREAGRADLGGHIIDMTDASIDSYATRHGIASREEARRELITRDGMGRTNVQAMAAGHTAQIVHEMSVASRLVESPGSTPEERVEGATRLLEFQKSINYASGDGQKIINAQLAQAGIKHNSSVSIEEQLVDIVNSSNQTATNPVMVPTQVPGLPSITPGAVLSNGTQLSRMARTWDRETDASGGQRPDGTSKSLQPPIQKKPGEF